MIEKIMQWVRPRKTWPKLLARSYHNVPPNMGYVRTRAGGEAGMSGPIHLFFWSDGTVTWGAEQDK